MLNVAATVAATLWQRLDNVGERRCHTETDVGTTLIFDRVTTL